MVLAGCGGGGSVKITPPPTGGFSNSNFNGTYTFAVSGANGNGIFAMGGALVACGCSQGNISSGTIDIDDPTGAQPGLSLLSNSSYQITPDGRGTARLFFNTATISGYEIDLDFVLTSSSHGLVIRYDGNGTASGTIDLQTSVTQAQLAKVFAYTLSGSDLSNNSLASVGEFSLDSTGLMTSGIADFNYIKVPSQLALSGSLVVGSGTTPGTASLQTSFSSTPLTFDVFAIDATHLKLIENDGQSILAGDVLLSPSAAFPSGNLAFSMAGLDSASNLFVAGGIMASDGVSAISNNSFEDVNDNGVVDNGTNPITPFAFSGSFAENPSGSGRFVVTLTGFAGGTTFVAYPSSGGLLMLEEDSGLGAGVTGGIALEQQSGVTDLSAQGYGLNLTGADLSILPATEVDEIAEFKANAGALSGFVDVNDGGSISTQGLTGTYSATNGLGSATLTAGLGSMFYYVVDGSTALFISTDPTQSTFGSMEVQTTPSSSAALATPSPHVLPMFRVIPHARSAAQRGKIVGKK